MDWRQTKGQESEAGGGTRKTFAAFQTVFNGFTRLPIGRTSFMRPLAFGLVREYLAFIFLA